MPILKNPWDYWYDRAVWKRRRMFQLRQNPFCEMCLEDGQAVVATEVDHIEPHKGNWNKFRLGAVQSLCATHHQSTKKRQENRGYSSHVDSTGMPLDPRHPIHRGRA